MPCQKLKIRRKMRKGSLGKSRFFFWPPALWRDLGRIPLKLQQLKFQQRKGFSLVELLTVVAILGVLSAVAVPTYTRYRKQAGLKALAADAKNIKKAILACSAMFPFSSCDSAAEIEIEVVNLRPAQKHSPNVCFRFEREIGGIVYKQCVSVNTSSGAASETNSEPFCYKVTQSPPPPPITYTYTKHPDSIECNSAADCPSDYNTCHTGNQGTCNTTAQCA